MIDLTKNNKIIERSVKRLQQYKISLPTFAQMRDPSRIPKNIKDRLASTGLWDIDPINLYRINWHNQPVEKGGGYGRVNYLEIPTQLTGVRARVVGLVGKWFPTGSHKVGATYACLVPRLATGQFDPTTQKAVWPSTGNYCRGGAFNAALLSCESIAILPEEMSCERFEWLKKVAGEVIATPGSESNVKEIYDKCDELKATRDNISIFNQFDEFGNYLWHYHVTGPAMEEVARMVMKGTDRVAGVVSSTGSAGTIASGDYIKDTFPQAKIVAAEALQCPTLLYNGFGSHRIEGIGDKHIPWIHNVRNLDFVAAVDDNGPMNLLRLFNEPLGRKYMAEQGIASEIIDALPLLGISSLGNLIASIKFAKYNELTEKDVVLTVFTDSMDMYGSRLAHVNETKGPYNTKDAYKDHNRYLLAQQIDNIEELSYYTRKRIHNLKYYTWIEQQGRSVGELDAQWYDSPEYWENIQNQVDEIDKVIEEMNQAIGQV